MKGRLPDKARVEHILDSLKTIDLFIDGLTFEEFALDLKTTFAVVKALEIVGETANHVSNETQTLDSTVDWGAIIALRHALVHEYYGIGPEFFGALSLNTRPNWNPKSRP